MAKDGWVRCREEGRPRSPALERRSFRAPPPPRRFLTRDPGAEPRPLSGIHCGAFAGPFGARPFTNYPLGIYKTTSVATVYALLAATRWNCWACVYHNNSYDYCHSCAFFPPTRRHPVKQKVRAGGKTLTGCRRVMHWSGVHSIYKFVRFWVCAATTRWHPVKE